MRGRPASMLAILACSCIPASQCIVNLAEIAPKATVQGSMGMQMAGEGVRDWTGVAPPSSRIAASRLSLRGGAGSTVAAKRTPYKQSALRSGVTWTGKALAAAFSSLLTTSAAMVTFEFTAQKIHPAMAEAGMPHGVAALVTVGAVVGSILGGYVIGKLSPSHPSLLALLVGLVFTAAQYLNLDSVQHPKWFPMAGLLSFVPPYLAAVALTAAASPRVVKLPPKSASPAKKAQEAEPVAAAVEVETKGSKTPKTPAKTPGKTPRGKKGGKTPAKTPKSKK